MVNPWQFQYEGILCVLPKLSRRMDLKLDKWIIDTNDSTVFILNIKQIEGYKESYNTRQSRIEWGWFSTFF